MEVLLRYLKQKSTWAGIIGIIGAFGVSVSPELAAEIGVAGVAVASIIAILFDEDKGDE